MVREGICSLRETISALSSAFDTDVNTVMGVALGVGAGFLGPAILLGVSAVIVLASSCHGHKVEQSGNGSIG